VGYRWKGPFNAYNFCMTFFLLNPIFTLVKVKIKNLLKKIYQRLCRLCRKDFFLFSEKMEDSIDLNKCIAPFALTK